jgi:hypothetical protein
VMKVAVLGAGGVEQAAYRIKHGRVHGFECTEATASRPPPNPAGQGLNCHEFSKLLKSRGGRDRRELEWLWRGE